MTLCYIFLSAFEKNIAIFLCYFKKKHYFLGLAEKKTMSNISIVILSLLLLPVFCFADDDLLGARCQSRCLFKLEAKLKVSF